MKKITALVIALIMALTLGTTALATSVTEGGEDAAGTSAAHVVALKKSLKLTDTTTGIALYAPEISFQYTLNAEALTADELGYNTKSGDAGDLNKDYMTNGKSIEEAGIKVRDGLTETGAPAVSIAAPAILSFSSTDVLPAEMNTGNEGDNLIVKMLGINISAGTVPGIYRFRITESLAEGSKSREEAGVTHNENYAQVRYLDVYVTYDEADQLEVSNAVLFRYENGSATKTEGWTSANDPEMYETVDVTVKKTITGNLADKNHEFPFSFNVTDPATGSLYSYKDDDAEIIAGAAFGTQVNEAYLSSVLGLENGSTFTIYGLPKNAAVKSTVTVSEKNDTPDTYTYETVPDFRGRSFEKTVPLVIPLEEYLATRKQ